MTTYLLTLSQWTKPIDLWTLGGIANSLQDRSLPCVCPSNNEDSELEIVGDFGEDLLCIPSRDPDIVGDIGEDLLCIYSMSPDIIGYIGEDLLCTYSTSPRRLALRLSHAMVTVR